MDHNEDDSQRTDDLEQAPAHDIAEVENNVIDQQFITDLLTVCHANVNGWIATYGVQKTRRHIRQLFWQFLHKETDDSLGAEGEDEEGAVVALYGYCAQCRTAYYTAPPPPNPAYMNYPMFVQCMNGCTP